MAELSETRQIGAKRILIVEDDPIVAKVYQRRLEKAGFAVTIAAEGSDGFFSLVKDKPDGVLLDLMLPQMDGLNILRKTRAQKMFQNTPIVVFSNAFMNGLLQDAAEAGATMVVNKSDASAVESVVEAFLQNLCRFPTMRMPMQAAQPAQQISQQQTAVVTEVQEQSAPTPAANQANVVRQNVPATVAPAQEAVAEPTAKGSDTEFRRAPQRKFGVFPVGRARASAALSTPLSESSPAAEPVSQVGRRESSGSFGALAETTSAQGEKNDMTAEREILQVFFDSGNETIAAVRQAMRDYQRTATTSSEGRQCLESFYRAVRRLTSVAAMCSSESISNFAACLEALLHELMTNPSSFAPSTLKTLAMAVDVLSRMFKEAGKYECPMISQAMVLVVDDDVVSQRALTLCLQKARLNAMCANGAAAALEHVKQIAFELIFLDVSMPDVDGFELCTRIRQTPGYEMTPIVFVTGLTDFQSRARSVATGANDFVSKPVCRIEMTVKALSFVMKGRLAGATIKANSAVS